MAFEKTRFPKTHRDVVQLLKDVPAYDKAKEYKIGTWVREDQTTVSGDEILISRILDTHVSPRFGKINTLLLMKILELQDRWFIIPRSEYLESYYIAKS